jgi:hypothetical protein
MFDSQGMTDENELHLEMIKQIWSKIASEVYGKYKEQGRGIVVFFMLDNMPEEVETILPPDAEPTGKGAAGAYIPRDYLLPLENLVGEQGLLQMDRVLGQYDPDKTIVFAFIRKFIDDDGKRGIKAAGYEITPSPETELSPRAMWNKRKEKKEKIEFAAYRQRKPGDKNNPIINLN